MVTAKARQQERDKAARLAQSSDARNSNAKRPLVVASADSTSPTAPNTRTNPSRPALRGAMQASSALQNAVASGSGSNSAGTDHFKRGAGATPAPLRNMIGTYVEYDLATLKNSRGGFLLENEEDDPRKINERAIIEENKRKRMENMRKANMHDIRKLLPFHLGVFCVCGKEERDSCVFSLKLFHSTDLKCPNVLIAIRSTSTFSFVESLVSLFARNVNPSDRTSTVYSPRQNVKRTISSQIVRPNMFLFCFSFNLRYRVASTDQSQILTAELKDAELLPHLLRPNPHRPTYSNMMLFLRRQVEAFAFSDKKWGSGEALDAEFARREAEKKNKKSRKFEKKLKELRKKTSTNVWHRRVDGEHKHIFEDGDDDEGVQKCVECGFEIEVEVF